MDLGTQFCERCGRDRDSYASARNTYYDCPKCSAACCADCWNLVDGACLACAPFRLADETARPRIVVAAAPPAAAAASDPYADLRADSAPLEAWDASWGTARQRPKEAAAVATVPAHAAPDAWRTVVAEADPAPPRNPRRRAGRIGLAASAAWVVVAALAVVALGASPSATVPAPAEIVPTATPTAAPTATPNRAPATPRATRAPTPAPVVVIPGAGAPRVTPRPTRRPSTPVVVAPPPPTPRPTLPPAPAPTPAPPDPTPAGT